MRHAATLDAFRRLGLTITPGIFDVLTESESEGIISLSEAGRRHAKTDLDRLDAAIRTLVDVRYDDDITRNRARKALSSILDIKDALGDPADPDAEVEDVDPEDEEQALKDSKGADKAAKATEQKAGGKTAERPVAADKSSADKGQASGGGKSIELKIAASDDGPDLMLRSKQEAATRKGLAESEDPWTFIGTVADVTESDVTFDIEDDDEFSQVTLGMSEIASFEAITEALLVEHPGHGSQMVHGRRGKVTATSSRAVWKAAVDKAYGGKAPKGRGGLRWDRGPAKQETTQQALRRLAKGAPKLGPGGTMARDLARLHPGVKFPSIHASFEGTSVIAEANPAEGTTWDVLLIQPGTSKNRRRYRREVLQEAVRRGAFEGARAYVPDGPDHFGFGPYGRKRGAKELVGWWSDIRYGESIGLPDGKLAEGVVGTFHVSEAASWLRTMLTDSWARGKYDLVGWSIVGDGDMKVVRGEDGRPVADVGRLDAVESIDPVVNPAAGGRTLRLVASMEGAVNWQTLTLAEAIRSLGDGTILPDELRENRPDLARAIESFDESDSTAESVARTVAEATVAKFQTVQMAEAKIALRPRLAESVKARIRESINRALAEGTLDEAGIDSIIKTEVDYVSQFAPASVKDSGVVVSDMKSERERMVEAAYDGLTGKDPRFSIARFYTDLTGDTSFSGKYAEGGRLSEAIVAESFTSSTFDQIMADSITRRMLDYYNLPGLDAWRQIVNVESIKDFRTYRRTRYGGYGNLPSVSQGQPYVALTSPTDEEATFSISKRGGTEDMTLEAIANDDLGALRDIPRRLGRAASQTLHEFAFDFLKDNPTIYDSTALFHATHGSNLGSTALDSAPLAAGRLAMKKQTDMSNAKRLGISPKFLVVPADLEQKAYELTATDREVASANNTLNFIRTFGLTVIVVDYWTDTNNWYLVADPASVPTIALGFFNGNQEPELFVQDSPTVGNVFTNDKITYKIRHIYGGAVMDYRGFYGAVVA